MYIFPKIIDVMAQKQHFFTLLIALDLAFLVLGVNILKIFYVRSYERGVKTIKEMESAQKLHRVRIAYVTNIPS